MESKEFRKFTRSLGASIQAYRKGAGYTQEVLGRKIRKSSAHLSKIERGEKVPSVDLLWLICQQLKVPLENLVGQPSSTATDPVRLLQRQLMAILVNVSPKRAELIVAVARKIAESKD